MENIVGCLERIATSLEEMVRLMKVNNGIDSTVEPKGEITDEEELFRSITKVYYSAEKGRIAKGGKKKSAHLVSDGIRQCMMDFLREHLSEPEYIVENQHGGVLLVKRAHNSNMLIKVHTDLGYHRGENWNQTVKDLLNIAKNEYDIAADNVLFFVVTMVNGLDNDSVCKVLDRKISNAALLQDRMMLNKYLAGYVKTLTVLPNPEEQVFFLAADIHPNIIAGEWLKANNQQGPDLSGYQWLNPSIQKLIAKIKEVEN